MMNTVDFNLMVRDDVSSARAVETFLLDILDVICGVEFLRTAESLTNNRPV